MSEIKLLKEEIAKKLLVCVIGNANTGCFWADCLIFQTVVKMGPGNI